MAVLNRTCKACGKKYRYCPSCLEDAYKPTWMTMFHDENCKKIFKILVDNFSGYITNDETKELLNECDTSVEFVPDVQNDIDRVLKTKDIKNETKKQKKGD